MNFFTENWINITSNAGLAIAWLFDRNKLKRSQNVIDDSQSIANLRAIIDEVREYNRELIQRNQELVMQNIEMQKRLNEIEIHFDKKCSEMQREIDNLRRKK